MAETKTMTAPLARIEIDGEVVGKMKNIRVTENFRRGDVRGLGRLTADEKPVLAFDGTFSASFYTIDLKKIGTIAASKFGVNRNMGSMEDFVNTILFNEIPVDITILKKTLPSGQPNTAGVVTSISYEDFAVLRKCYIDSQNFDISEGNVSGTDISGTYIEPILFSV